MTLRAEIAQSWRRAELSGLKPDSPADRLAGADVADIDTRSRLLRAADPVLTEISRHLQDTRLSVLLADRDCRIVARRYGDKTLERALDAVSAVPGCRFSEEISGTNSLATPHELRRGVAVHGDEHFLDALKPFTCYGHPITNPATGRLEGVLDITGLVEDANPLLAPFLLQAVTDIERRLLDGSNLAQQRLLAAFQAAQHRSSAVLALGEDVVLANSAAVDLVDPADHPMLRELSRTRRGVRRVRLSSGTEVEVRMEAVSVNAGMLFELAPLRPAYSAATRRRSPESVVPADVEDRLRRSAAARRRVLITGEPGTGRDAATATLAGSQPVARADAGDVAPVGEAEWAARLDRLAATHQGLVVMRDVHLLPPLAVSRLARLLDTTSAWFAFTARQCDTARAGGTETGEVDAELLARVHRRVELPPLRARRGDIPTLARAILAGVHPDGTPRLTAGALELLAAQPWPGNLRELETVLTDVTEGRSAGDVTARDLAPLCPVTTTAPALSGWQQAEYEAITRALAAVGGNKVKAARDLGISRSTLYNRLRTLHITTA
ncbi:MULTISPECIES: sigma-54-dependent Fis family transcriptional regulator [Prauserella salsuginis group]|uniref:Sigma-54-dependent Fis family transcriptional regulator n=1 Tax=Prauserella salsuginis TaxID=387889 RepID=A0ABW6G0H6_9PSEU|nr:MULTISPECIES: helix-turn-helix domain-containing protein [Prauserella salsuginis group]MCR3721322.1 Transcriptional regulator of acetoin/glycerol metabolism [Prauserella flava]MCR3734598.1 Transcriptional regulator of acetoin/glycerol metabolism [Prauserella salsuginis]